MPNIFVDIETVPRYATKDEYLRVKNGIDQGSIHRNHPDRNIQNAYWKKIMGALNPIMGKVIMIAYQVNDCPTERLIEWESSESDILKKLYYIISSNKGSKDDPLNVIGFNITTFDWPFLFSRCMSLEIKNGYNGHDPYWLYHYFHSANIQDILSIHLPLNGFSRYGLNHNAVAMAYGFPTKGERGSVNTDYYYNEEYDKILNYTEAEFIYPQLYKKMKDGLVSEKKLQESVEFWIKKYKKEREEK
ncbi:MAG: hypothetical protein OXC46_07930 [Thaumarchaeota archaeon]|nr:hypothetical protein [Nitrososphaerota archaeon]